MNAKISAARQLVEECLTTHRAPIVSCSFGKDSMAMLHLIRELGHALPVLFNRAPFFPRKYTYANRIIAEWNLTVYDFPPTSSALRENPRPTSSEQIDFVETHSFGNGLAISGMFGAYEPAAGERFLCGLHDVLLRPKGALHNPPWDLLFLGSKTSDDKPQGNLAALAFDVKRGPAAALAFPLRQWTDADVWEYLEAHDVPIDHGRYEKTAVGWQERADQTENSDSFPVCTRCLRRDGPAAVHCPRFGYEVNNVAASVPWHTGKLCDYFGDSNETKPARKAMDEQLADAARKLAESQRTQRAAP